MTTPTSGTEPEQQTTEPATPVEAALQTPAAPPSLVTAHWWNRRIPLFVSLAALILGCILGAGITAIGAVAVGDHGRGDDRSHSVRDGHDRPDGRESDGGHESRRDENRDHKMRSGDDRRFAPPKETAPAPSPNTTTSGAASAPVPSAS